MNALTEELRKAPDVGNIPSRSGVTHALCRFQSPDSRKWRESYRAAILEADSTKLPERIAEAEKALVQRARELFQKTGDNIEEEQALDDAMYVLHGLRSTCKRNLNMSERNPEGLDHMRTGTW